MKFLLTFYYIIYIFLQLFNKLISVNYDNLNLHILENKRTYVYGFLTFFSIPIEFYKLDTKVTNNLCKKNGFDNLHSISSPCKNCKKNTNFSIKFIKNSFEKL